MNEFYQKGKEEALEDIEANKLKLKVSGLKVRWFQEWRKILSDEFGVEIDVIAGCMVLDKDSDYAGGYNEISEKELEKRFGNDILEKTLEKAKSIWESKLYIPSEPFENENEEIIASPNSFGWIKCPNCNKSFKISGVDSWNGKIHLSCRQKIKIIEVEY
ncbi:MAG: hypothetical protein ACR2J3_02735 [Aridibacter sp.]